jgi:hypothetical protein
MWPKTRKLNALLAPLAPVIDGQTSDGQLKGSYHGYAVEARPHSGYPISYRSSGVQGAVGPEPVHMLRVVLVGVPGYQFWCCQSSASSPLQDLASKFTAGPLLGRFKPGEFRFEGVDTLKESVARMGEKLVERLGMPIAANADPALQERLIAAGLFAELDSLRWGGHPYLPKAEFSPGGRALGELYMRTGAFTRSRPAVEERVRAVGLPDYQSLLEAHIGEIEAEHPGRLEVDVEAGKDKVPGAARFRDLLEHAVQIAQLNADVNQPSPLP